MVRWCIGAGSMGTDWVLVWRVWYSWLMGNPGDGRAFFGCWQGSGVLSGTGVGATALVNMVDNWSSAAI